MYYIQRKGEYLETVDEFETRKEARQICESINCLTLQHNTTSQLAAVRYGANSIKADAQLVRCWPLGGMPEAEGSTPSVAARSTQANI